MSITAYNGNGLAMQYPRPWDAAGAMSTYYTAARQWTEWCITPRSFFRIAVGYNANGTACTLWCPPLPSNMNAAWRCSNTSVFTAGYQYYPYASGWYQAANSLTSSGLSTVNRTGERWFLPAVSVAACSAWGVTTTQSLVIVSREPTATANGYGAGPWYGQTSYTSFDTAMTTIPTGNHTGLSTAHYNSLVRALRRSEWTPACHAYFSILSTSAIDTVTALENIRVPICYSQFAPKGQRTFSFVVASVGNHDSAKAYLYHGEKKIELQKHWILGPMAEYRADVGALLDGESPDITGPTPGCERNIYSVKLSVPNSKAATFRALSVWSGVPA